MCFRYAPVRIILLQQRPGLNGTSIRQRNEYNLEHSTDFPLIQEVSSLRYSYRDGPPACTDPDADGMLKRGKTVGGGGRMFYWSKLATFTALSGTKT
jgi:hypothetical protein